jgi:hypothetical protein
MQARQLFFPQEQEDLEGKIEHEQVLQVLQEAYSAQRDQIVSWWERLVGYEITNP